MSCIAQVSNAFSRLVTALTTILSLINGGHQQELSSISQVDGTTNNAPCSLMKETTANALLFICSFGLTLLKIFVTKGNFKSI